MRKILLLTLFVAPLLICCSKKDKQDPQGPPPIAPGTWIEVAPVDGRSTITFNNDHTFTVRNLIQQGGIPNHVYKYKIENGKIVATAPPYDSYWLRNPIEYQFTNDGELHIDNFRPSIWQEKVDLIRFKKL